MAPYSIVNELYCFMEYFKMKLGQELKSFNRSLFYDKFYLLTCALLEY